MKEQPLFTLFEHLGISFQTYAHLPVMTAEEAEHVCADVPGLHVRNLFLRDKAKHYYLVTLRHNRQAVDLKKLRQQIGAKGNFSFASADDLRELLNVEPGSVTPFALLNDTKKQVRFVADEELACADFIAAHPLRNDMTTVVNNADFRRFFQHLGVDVQFYCFD